MIDKNFPYKDPQRSSKPLLKKWLLTYSFISIMLINLALKEIFCIVIKQKKADTNAPAFKIKYPYLFFFSLLSLQAIFLQDLSLKTNKLLIMALRYYAKN